MKSILFITIMYTTVMQTSSTRMLHSDFEPGNHEFHNKETATCETRYCNNMPSDNYFGCSCDNKCWRKKFCCLNYLNKTNVDNGTFYFGIPKAHIERAQLYQCHSINPNEDISYSMISKCWAPHKDNNQLWQWQKTLCEQQIRPKNAEDHLLRIPVYSYSTGETYKNIYCAACHDDLSSIAPWTTTAACTPAYIRVNSVKEALHNLYVNHNGENPPCYLRVQRSHEMKVTVCPSPCDNNVTGCPLSFVNMSTSREDGDRRREIEWLCQVTFGLIQINHISYTNIYCAACHLNETDVASIIKSKYGRCYRDYCSTTYSGSAFPSLKSFNVFMDFKFFSIHGNRVGVNKRCSTGHIYDKFTNKCRLIACPKGYHLHNSECEQPQHNSTKATNTSPTKLTIGIMEDPRDDVTILTCSKMLLQRHEVVINENGTLILNQQLYPTGTYEIINNDTINVCVDVNDNYVFVFESVTHVYMTLICISVSLLALLLKIIVFAVTLEIRKFADKLVFCLSDSLFIGQLLFLLPMSPTTNYIACASVGVLTHYFFLSSFTWMNVLAYDICNTFTKCTQSPSVHSDSMKRRFHCYSLYAWVTPMLIVSAASVFDWSGVVDESSIMRPHYGVNLCWISKRTALLFYFAIPMAVLLLANIAFFVITAFSICRSSLASSMVQSTENSQDCCQNQSRSPHHLRFSIYVKLCVTMGLTWISGFVAAFSGYEWLWYVFTLTSASQGVYILIALTPFNKVLQITSMKFKRPSK